VQKEEEYKKEKKENSIIGRHFHSKFGVL